METVDKNTQAILDGFGSAVQDIKEKRLILDCWAEIGPVMADLIGKPWQDECLLVIGEAKADWLRYVSCYVYEEFDQSQWDKFLKDSSKLAIENAIEKVAEIIEAEDCERI
jgi:hypothetical protein